MAQLEKFIKVTQEQYNTLQAGGTVGSHTGINPNFIYLVENNGGSDNSNGQEIIYADESWITGQEETDGYTCIYGVIPEEYQSPERLANAIVDINGIKFRCQYYVDSELGFISICPWNETSGGTFMTYRTVYVFAQN